MDNTDTKMCECRRPRRSGSVYTFEGRGGESCRGCGLIIEARFATALVTRKWHGYRRWRGAGGKLLFRGVVRPFVPLAFGR